MMTGRMQAELERQRLEAEIASLQSEIEETASRASVNNSNDDLCSLGSLSTHAKRVVVRRVVRKVRHKSNPHAASSIPLTPVNETPQAVQDARTAEQHRQQLEREIAAMEAAIVSQRKLQLKKIVASGNSSRNLSQSAGSNNPPMPSRSLPPRPPATTSNKRVDATCAPLHDDLDRPNMVEEQDGGSSTGTKGTLASTASHCSDTAADSPTAPARAIPLNFLSSITQAVSARDQRVETGETIQRDHVPEVDAPKSTTPQLSFDLAEMVSKAARNREQRLENGGESKMRAVPAREELKSEYKNIVVEAAQLGRLTRLREHVVEATALEKTPEQEWRSQGLLAIQWRSNHMSVIHQAAQAGAASKLPEKVVTNFSDEQALNDAVYDHEMDGRALSPRMVQLLELNQRVGSGQHKVDKLILGRKEERGVDSLIVKPMWCYSNVDDVVLPKATPPKINVEQKRRELAKRPMIDISNEAATKAWERRARLDRPNIMPKIKEQCSCCWCRTASPFQTYAYKVKEMRQKFGDVEDGLAIKHHHDMERRERERRKAERLRRQARANDDDYSIDDDWDVQSHQNENNPGHVLLSNMPLSMSQNGDSFLGSAFNDESRSIYSSGMSVDQSVTSSGSSRVVRKVRKVRRVSRGPQASVAASSDVPKDTTTQLDPVLELTSSEQAENTYPPAPPPETAPLTPPLASKQVDTPCACVIL